MSENISLDSLALILSFLNDLESWDLHKRNHKKNVKEILRYSDKRGVVCGFVKGKIKITPLCCRKCGEFTCSIEFNLMPAVEYARPKCHCFDHEVATSTEWLLDHIRYIRLFETLYFDESYHLDLGFDSRNLKKYARHQLYLEGQDADDEAITTYNNFYDSNLKWDHFHCMSLINNLGFLDLHKKKLQKIGTEIVRHSDKRGVVCGFVKGKIKITPLCCRKCGEFTCSIEFNLMPAVEYARPKCHCFDHEVATSTEWLLDHIRYIRLFETLYFDEFYHLDLGFDSLNLEKYARHQLYLEGQDAADEAITTYNKFYDSNLKCAHFYCMSLINGFGS
jgi:hypothetical protein